MFTNNYIALQKLMFLNTGNASTSVINAAGGKSTCYLNFCNYFGIGWYMKKGKCGEIKGTYTGVAPTADYNMTSGVFFGSGSRPAAKDDYTLQSPITSGLSITNPSLVLLNPKEGEYSYVSNFVIKNTTDAEINIYEIGLFIPVCTGSYTYNQVNANTPWATILMDRTVLTKPITIPAGGTRVVTYKITFNHFLNVE